jgi:amidase
MTRLSSSRRWFLFGAGAVTIAPFITRMRASRAATNFDPSFGTATQALGALRAGIISSRELTEHVFRRIKKYNAKINAFVTLLEAQAMEQARKADHERADKSERGALHGLPILVKDAFSTAGIRTTSGSASLEHYVPRQDAIVVARLKRAGAIIVGKTNLPDFAGDWQSYNDVAGTTNNPWDLTRTPGGSTGGGAAALAAGFGFLEIGSDIAGSIRVTANFCGVYGHKSSRDLVPQEGHIPPPPGNPGAPMLLPAIGPLARSPEDLLLELGVVAGPPPDQALAYRWTLPKPRKSALRDYKLGFVLDDPFCAVDRAVKYVLMSAIENLRRAGAQLTEGWPQGFDPASAYDNYAFLLSTETNEGLPDTVTQQNLKLVAGGLRDPDVRGSVASHRDWQHQTERRVITQNTWRDYFKNFDAFLSPTTFVPAFPHDHAPVAARKLAANGAQRAYSDLRKWIDFATLTGCPATVAPVGLIKSGLPVGLQITGPFLEDATPIDVAMKVRDVCGGFVLPPGYGA